MGAANIFRGAKLLIDEHGEAASHYATQEMISRTKLDDKVGADHWRDILAAIAQIRLANVRRLR